MRQPDIDTPDDAQERRARYTRAIVGLVWLTLFAGLFLSGVGRDLTVEDTAELVRAAGMWGVAGYLLAFTFLQPLGLSAHILVIGGALIWSPWIIIPLALTGALGSSITSYLVARYVAFNWVQAHLPRRLRKYESWLVDRGLKGVIGFRLLTFTTPPAQYMMGTTRVQFPTMLLGTLIGFIPHICLDVFLGGELMRVLLDAFGIA